MVHANAYKKLGRVADGRIRKNWPTHHPTGPPKAAWLETKGLENTGLVCWRNALLQCLLHVPEFFHYLSREERCGNWRCYTEPINKDKAYRCVFCALRDLALHYWSSTSTRIRFKKLAAFHNAMELHPGREPGDVQGPQYTFLDPTRQHDPHEFFGGMTNMLKYVNFDHRIDRVDGELVRNVAIDRLFRTSLNKQWTCEDCGQVSNRRDTEFGLQLSMPITRLAHRNLQHYIRSYFEPADTQVACSPATCNGANKWRSRSTCITNGPEIMVIQMVRIRMNMFGHGSRVLYRIVPDDRLDLSEYTARVPGTDDNMALKYELHGIVSHAGTRLKGGHYIATVRCRNGVDFANANDENIKNLGTDVQKVFEEAETPGWQSYVLVYQKVGGKMANCM